MGRTGGGPIRDFAILLAYVGRWFDRPVDGGDNPLGHPPTGRPAEIVLATGPARYWGAVSDVEFSHDGRLLTTASYDGTIKLWDVARILGR